MWATVATVVNLLLLAGLCFLGWRLVRWVLRFATSAAGPLLERAGVDLIRSMPAANLGPCPTASCAAPFVGWIEDPPVRRPVWACMVGDAACLDGLLLVPAEAPPIEDEGRDPAVVAYELDAMYRLTDDEVNW